MELSKSEKARLLAKPKLSEQEKDTLLREACRLAESIARLLDRAHEAHLKFVSEQPKCF